MWNELEGAQALYGKMDWWKRGGELIRGNLGKVMGDGGLCRLGDVSLCSVDKR